MKALLIFILTFLYLSVNATPKDSINLAMSSAISNSTKAPNYYLSTQNPNNVAAHQVFSISTDWLLETKAELINGITYSPTLEFNLNHPNGFNFQIQTGALPIINGLQVQKTQPAAGLSFSYKF